MVVKPGKWHEVTAALALKAIEALAEKNGVKLDMGTVKPVSEYVSGSSDGPMPEPMDVAPRVVAHIANRIPGLRKLGKLSETKSENKSGIVTDVLTLVSQLLERNEELVMDKGLEVVGLASSPNASQGHTQQSPEITDVVYVDDVPLVQPE